MWSMKWRRFQHYYWIGSLMFWGTVAECATHLLSQWIRCLMKSKMMSFFFYRQEKRHIRTVCDWQLPRRKRFWSTAVFIDRAKHPVYSHQILTEEHAVFMLRLFVEEVLYIMQNAGLHTGLDGLEVVWQRLIIIKYQLALQTQRRNAH